jgi:hypothetical protein
MKICLLFLKDIHHNKLKVKIMWQAARPPFLKTTTFVLALLRDGFQRLQYLYTILRLSCNSSFEEANVTNVYAF